MDKRTDFEDLVKSAAHGDPIPQVVWFMGLGSVEGPGKGVIYRKSAVLNLAVDKGDRDGAYLQYSVDDGSTWAVLPNNMPVRIDSAADTIRYAYNSLGATWRLGFGFLADPAAA